MASAQDLKSGDEEHTDSHSHSCCESALAHNHAQLHNKSEIIQGQALEIDFEIWEPIGSSGHQGQLWSSGEMPSVALRSPAITQISCSMDSFCACGQNLMKVVLGTFQENWRTCHVVPK